MSPDFINWDQILRVDIPFKNSILLSGWEVFQLSHHQTHQVRPDGDWFYLQWNVELPYMTKNFEFVRTFFIIHLYATNTLFELERDCIGFCTVSSITFRFRWTFRDSFQSCNEFSYQFRTKSNCVVPKLVVEIDNSIDHFITSKEISVKSVTLWK